MRLDRIYTRGGDDGRTSLGDGTRTPKFALRVEAYGDLDEANASIGAALLHVQDGEARDALHLVQNDLFDVGADLCRPEREGETRTPLRVGARQVERLEQAIDHFNAALEPLTSFVLPGGSPASALLHQARTVVRRAERRVAELGSASPVNPEALRYVNRLSDLLFVLARHENGRGRDDVLWTPGLNL
jgi:cob(I)alamin adenosyltransferase